MVCWGSLVHGEVLWCGARMSRPCRQEVVWCLPCWQLELTLTSGTTATGLPCITLLRQELT